MIPMVMPLPSIPCACSCGTPRAATSQPPSPGSGNGGEVTGGSPSPLGTSSCQTLVTPGSLASSGPSSAWPAKTSALEIHSDT